MTWYSLEPRTIVLSFSRNLYKKHGKQLLDTACNAGLDAVRDSSKKK